MILLAKRRREAPKRRWIVSGLRHRKGQLAPSVLRNVHQIRADSLREGTPGDSNLAEKKPVDLAGFSLAASPDAGFRL